MFLEFVALVVALLLGLRFYCTWNYKYWAEKGVPYIEGRFPFGNIKDVVLMRRTIGEVYDEIYWKFPDKPFGGFYKLRQPILMIREPELVKAVLVRDFNCFHDNDYYVNPKVDPILGLNPFNSKGEQWKHSRGIITPSLTLGKIKAMVPQMTAISQELVKFVGENENTPVEAYDMMGKYTTDVVASCAYGVHANSFENPDGELRSMSKKVFDGSFVTNMALLFAFYAPKLGEITKLKMMSQEVSDFFVRLVQTSVESREKNNCTRNDYLQSLINADLEKAAKNGDTKPIHNYLELAAYCMTFFLDGYDTAAILASFIFYELALNEDVQDKLREELRNTSKTMENFDFDSIHALEYLDMIVSETLRKHPPGTTTTRVCTQETTLSHGDYSVKVEVGTPVVLPMYSIHNDPNNFPCPETFDPTRFTEENRAKWNHYAYFPFGHGPRSCPGFKFALSMVKLAVIGIILEYKISCKEKPTGKLELDPMNTFFHSAKHGLWLKYEKLPN